MELGGVCGRWLAGLVMLGATADPVGIAALGMDAVEPHTGQIARPARGVPSTPQHWAKDPLTALISRLLASVSAWAAAFLSLAACLRSALLLLRCAACRCLS